MDEGELALLEEKLTELIALRVLGAADPPADRLRALAARFPGALRELDRTPLDTLTSRLDALRAARAGGPIPAWAEVTSRFHGWLRIGLRLRRDAPRTGAGALEWARSYAPRLAGDPTRERLTEAVLRALVTPPEGRLVRVAVMLAAEDGGIVPAEVERLLHG